MLDISQISFPSLILMDTSNGETSSVSLNAFVPKKLAAKGFVKHVNIIVIYYL